MIFKDEYRNKKVFVTGHTGFKGSWLTIWLLSLGARVCGYSNGIPTTPSMFSSLNLDQEIEHIIGDIQDLDALQAAIKQFEPDYIFHLAAQAIVSESYRDPIETLKTNVIGTANLLEVLRGYNKKCTIVLITSDKCYENVEWEWGYKETDRLGGRDIYSGSKGAAEVVIHAYINSFFSDPDRLTSICTGRAGNVIGGGDWAKDRIVADCMRSWSDGRIVEIRSPNSTRPWQHVLEPLSGYLMLGVSLNERDSLRGESFNFGPPSEQNRTVKELIIDLRRCWEDGDGSAGYVVTQNATFHEAGLLKLNCDKALHHLKWEANLKYDECVNFVGEWYFKYYKGEDDMLKFTRDQIKKYENIGEARGKVWAATS